MLESPIVLNERDAGRARSTLARIEELAAPTSAIEIAKSKLSPEVIEKHRKAIKSAGTVLSGALAAYERARAGDFKGLLQTWRSEPGVMLIVARIARGLSQSDLAERLGVREQQIQRYETERYRSISLQNYRRIAAALGVEFEIKIKDRMQPWVKINQLQFTADDVKRVIEHGRKFNWFEEPKVSTEQQAFLLEYIHESTAQLGSPALLRTGLNVQDLTNDLLLAAWRARIIKQAEALSVANQSSFDVLNIAWLPDLVSLSVQSDGPRRARALLREHGIFLIVEPQIAGLKLDGAAFQVRGIPIIGMTIRHDRLDNFWFTLLHELAHIFLHQQSGLAAGFFDDLDLGDLDDIEIEANDFANAVLIPHEQWRTSPARISRSATAVEDFANQIGVHSAILFGRIRKERNNYSTFSDRIGSGQVRRQFAES